MATVTIVVSDNDGDALIGMGASAYTQLNREVLVKNMTLAKKYLPQNPDIEVYVPNYKEPILPVNHGGFGWYGLQAYNEQGQLMCHECGGFYDRLASHIHKHHLNGVAYKLKYGLRQGKSLMSNKARKDTAIAQKNRKDYDKFMARSTERIRAIGHESSRQHREHSLESYNQRDTCPQQLLRWLDDLSKVYGSDISERDIYREKPGLRRLLQLRFGSFNKAKQILKLSLNYHHNKFERPVILEDMVSFCNFYGHWPKIRDYGQDGTLCSYSTIRRNGALGILRIEAMKLREEQEARRIRGEQIPQYANNIEFQNAGRARR